MPVGQAPGVPWASQVAAATAANTASDPLTGSRGPPASPAPGTSPGATTVTSIGGVSVARRTPKLRMVRSCTSPAASTASPSLVTHPRAMWAAPTA